MKPKQILFVFMVTFLVYGLSGSLANVVKLPSHDQNYNVRKKDTFRVGLVRYKPVELENLPWDEYIPRAKAISVMKTNLANLERLVQKAAKQGAQLVATPEDSFTPANLNNQSLAYSWTETFAPVGSTVNPCLEYHSSDEEHFVARTLSCIARRNDVVLTANAEDRQPCTEEQWRTLSQCHSEGGYVVYNTQLVYDSDGSFITKYWKAHPFLNEKQFIKGNGHAVTFKKWGVEIGMIICYDINFDTPTKYFGENVHVLQIQHYINYFPIENAAMTGQGYSLYWNKTLMSADTASMAYQGSGFYNKGEPLSYTTSYISEDGVLVYDVPKISAPKIEASIENAISVDGFEPVTAKTFQYDSMEMKSFKVNSGTKGSVSAKIDNVECKLSFEAAQGRSGDNYVLVAGNGTIGNLVDTESCVFFHCPKAPECMDFVLSGKGGKKWQVSSKVEFEAFRVDMTSPTDIDAFMSFPHLIQSNMRLFEKSLYFANSTSVVLSDSVKEHPKTVQSCSISNVRKKQS